MSAFAQGETKKDIVPLMSHCSIQNQSKQDFVTSGRTNKFDFLIVADSHGRGINKFYFTKLFSNINWGVFIDNDYWQEELMRLCNSEKTKGIGSTFTCVKMFSDRFEVYWIGDSECRIYGVNQPTEQEPSPEVQVVKFSQHDYNNEEDIKRFKFRYIRQRDIQAVSPSCLKQVEAKMFQVKNEACNMTRTLGHAGCFCATEGYQIENKIIYKRDFNCDYYKIVVASDGFWQVMSEEKEDTTTIMDTRSNARLLAQMARNRWEQYWTVIRFTKTKQKVYIPHHNWDDVAVATWTIPDWWYNNTEDNMIDQEEITED